MSVPLEIIVGPLELYLAPVGEEFTAVDLTPAGNWVLVGSSGSERYAEDGITVTHGQSVNYHYTAGATGPVKASRGQETLMISVLLHDLTQDEYTRAINNVTPTDVAAGVGTIGTRTIQLHKGLDPAQFALIARGVGSGPTLAGTNFQYQVPIVVVDGDQAINYAKAEMAGLQMDFMALEDPNAATIAERFGQLVENHEAALP